MIYDEVVPKPDDVAKALDFFAAAVRARYGDRLLGVILFGSRARGDHQPGSDADVAVILVDGDWNFWREKRELADLTYEPLMDFGLKIQPWPVALSAWETPATHHNRRLIEAMKDDGRSLMAPT